MASIYSFVSFLSRPDIFKKHTSSALTKKFAIVVNYEMLYFGYKLWANNLYSLIKILKQMKAEVSISIDIIFICEAVGSCHIF